MEPENDYNQKPQQSPFSGCLSIRFPSNRGIATPGCGLVRNDSSFQCAKHQFVGLLRKSDRHIAFYSEPKRVSRAVMTVTLMGMVRELTQAARAGSPPARSDRAVEAMDTGAKEAMARACRTS